MPSGAEAVRGLAMRAKAKAKDRRLRSPTRRMDVWTGEVNAVVRRNQIGAAGRGTRWTRCEMMWEDSD
jgi:hypothetical protein